MGVWLLVYAPYDILCSAVIDIPFSFLGVFRIITTAKQRSLKVLMGSVVIKAFY